MEALGRVIDVAKVRSMPSYTETPSFWQGAVRPDFLSHLDEYNEAAVHVFSHNPGLYLDNRWHSFLAANSLDESPPMINDGAFAADYADEQVEHFEGSYALTSPLDTDLKEEVTGWLLLRPGGAMTIPSRLIWNAIPVIGSVVVLGVAACARRRWFWACCAAMVLARVPILFLSSPASYFMYYLPVYLSGGTLVTIACALALDRRLDSRPTPEDPVTPREKAIAP
jgi:hypothetical protein